MIQLYHYTENILKKKENSRMLMSTLTDIELTYFINFGVYITHLSPGSCLISPPSGIVNPGGYIMGPPGLHKTQTHVFTWRQQTCQHIWTSCVKSLK